MLIISRSSNGKTAGFDPVNGGSSPSREARKYQKILDSFLRIIYDRRCKRERKIMTERGTKYFETKEAAEQYAHDKRQERYQRPDWDVYVSGPFEENLTGLWSVRYEIYK
jgi:hypothetical protein